VEKRSVAALAAERQVLLTDIQRQRLETLPDVEAIGLRMVNRIGSELHGALELHSWRLVQLAAGLLAVLLVLSVLGILVARQFLLRETSRVPRPPGVM
jgi:hypothetical protein